MSSIETTLRMTLIENKVNIIKQPYNTEYASPENKDTIIGTSVMAKINKKISGANSSPIIRLKLAGFEKMRIM